MISTGRIILRRRTTDLANIPRNWHRSIESSIHRLFARWCNMPTKIAIHIIKSTKPCSITTRSLRFIWTDVFMRPSCRARYNEQVYLYLVTSRMSLCCVRIASITDKGSSPSAHKICHCSLAGPRYIQWSTTGPKTETPFMYVRNDIPNYLLADPNAVLLISGTEFIRDTQLSIIHWFYFVDFLL